MNRDRFRCFKCREYEYFSKDCPNMSEIIKDQTGQMQKMLASKQHETALKFLASDTYEGLIITHSEAPMDHLNP